MNRDDVPRCDCCRRALLPNEAKLCRDCIKAIDAEVTRLWDRVTLSGAPLAVA